MAAGAQPGNVFISHSHRDKQAAERLAAALEQNNIPVWWDRDAIPVGANFVDYLSEQASAAACVIVLWSHDSLTNKWVLQEAEIGLRRRVLLPVLIEMVEVPEAFAFINAATLTAWEGDPADSAFQHLLGGIQRFLEIVPSAAEETRLYKHSQRSAERRAEEFFQRNLRSETRIEHIDFERTAFYEELSWNLNSGINVLLGRNGYGKTYLLRGILALLQYNDDAALQTLSDGNASIALLRDGEEELIHFSDQFFDEEGAVGQIPILAIPDIRFVNRSQTALGVVTDETMRGDRADLCRFGAWHFLHERPYESVIQTFFYGLCLDYFQSGLRFDGEHFDLIRGVVRELTDRSFDFDRVAREGRDRFTLYVRTEGNEENPLPIQKSSQGTSSVIAMFGLIYDFLKSLKQESTTEIRQRSGIVMIDEVDAHLHPVWQQKIITLLRDRFPRVQFILSAHNPIVVAGCLEDEVSVMRKDTARGFSLVQFPNDFVGWQTEDIYRKVFEIENPDASFARFDAMRPFKGQLKQQAAALAEQPTRSAVEDRSLEELEEKLLYIEKVEQARGQRISSEALEQENRGLRDRLVGLESAHDSAARAQRETDALREALLRSQADTLRARGRSRVMTAAMAGIGILLLLVLVLFGILLLRG